MSDNGAYFKEQASVASQKYMNADGDSKEKEPSAFNKFMKNASPALLFGVAVVGLFLIFRKK